MNGRDRSVEARMQQLLQANLEGRLYAAPGEMGDELSDDSAARAVRAAVLAFDDTMREPPTPRVDLKPQLVVGRWKLLHKIGDGGFAYVYLAEHVQIAGKLGAVKFLKAFHAGGETLARFKQEAEVTSRLAGDHVVHVHDYGVLAETQPYIVYEYLSGHTLEEHDKSGGLDPVEIEVLIAQLCDGLADVHRNGIAHRDLSPKNVFICDRPPGRVKLIDFGLAKTPTELTQSNMEMGTLPYMSPEAMAGKSKAADHRADIHAVGAIAYELITGRRAFPGPEREDYVRQVLTEYPKPAHLVRPEVPVAIQIELRRALDKKPDRRHPNISALRDGLLAGLAEWQGATRRELSTPPVGRLEIVFRSRQDFEAGPGRGELIVHERSPGAALAVVDAGLESTSRGEQPFSRIVVSADPTLDDMLAAEYVRSIAAGQSLPPAADAFAHYGAVVREGLAPGGTNLHDSLQGIYLALRSVCGRGSDSDLRDETQAAKFLSGWNGLYRVITKAMESNAEPEAQETCSDSTLRRYRAYLHRDQDVYRQDVKRGERWLVRIPDGPNPASALLLRRPKSVMFKYWAREDAFAPTGDCYLLLVVQWSDTAWVVSTDPVQGLSLLDLHRVLQAHEGPGADADPWFDGEPYGHTLIASPHTGTRLDASAVEMVVRTWARAIILD